MDNRSQLMLSKRALVVDDSKSARAFLARILERHEITVDAAESAEAAIEYLARHRPDVIFMDHMMPGMDGFQAVQTIKNNPRTAAIPILMYTSQEGDLYLGQARALGAEGVLPKQIKQSDVTRMLYQLQLIADRRDREQTTFARVAQGMGQRIDDSVEFLPANESAIIVPAANETPAARPVSVQTGDGVDIAKLLPLMSLEIRAALDASLQKEFTALRGFLATSMASQSERLQGDLAAALPEQTHAAVYDVPTLLPERRAWPAIIGWSMALLSIAGAALLSWLWWQQGAEIAALRTDLDSAYAEVETLRARPVVSPAPVAVPPTDASIVPVATVPDVAGFAHAAAVPAVEASAIATATAESSAPVPATPGAQVAAPQPAGPPPTAETQ
jgi:CheY-like chemotaxis protein